MSDQSLFSQVAGLLRPVSKDVSNGQGKLCLSTVYLKKLNSAFDENVPEDLTSSFHLTDARASLQLDLQFLLDLIKRTVALKITPDLIGDEESNTVNLKRFTNIKILEIYKIDIKEILGIQRLRSQIQELSCMYNLETLSDILHKCGGDLSAPNLWSELRKANFSHNRLSDIDASLESTPWLNTLDLSYNQVISIEFVNVLPNLKYLNLSYNKLEMVPRFRGPVCKRLQVLLLNNNFIEDLSGLSSLSNLLQLDLCQNCLMDHKCFLSISHMPSLCSLNVQGNPINFHPHHRTITCNYLNKNTATLKFVLDNKPLTKVEKSLAGSLYPIAQSSLEASYNSSQNSLENTLPERMKKVRNVEIQEGFEEIVGKKKTPLSSTPRTNSEHLEVKSKIEQLRQQHGETWLSLQSGEAFQKVLGFEDSMVSNSSTPPKFYQEDKSRSFTSTSSKIIEGDKFSGGKVDASGVNTTIDDDTSFLTAQTQIAQDSENGTVVSDKDDAEGKEDSIFGQSAQSEEVEESLSDDEELCDGESFFASSVPDSPDYDLSIILTETHLSERDVFSFQQRARWHISSVKSCKEGEKPNEVQLVFDLLRRDRKSRTYYMDEPKKFLELLSALMIQHKDPNNTINYQCMKCNELFSRTKVSGVLVEVSVTCPKCDSNMIIESK